MRQSERIEVEGQARLHPNKWSSLEVELVDLSAEGFRVRCEARVRRGDLVTLDVPGAGPAAAFVIWTADGEFGAAFHEPLPLERSALRPAGAETVLARLLVRRAAAHKARLWDHEEALRRDIAGTLPVRGRTSAIR